MRFLLDESAEHRIATFLIDVGHDVKAIAYDYPRSLADADVLQIARTERRVLITNDRDFGELVFRQGLPHAGVIYFRLPLDTIADQKIDWLKRIIERQDDTAAHFVVVTPQGLRIS